MCTAGEGLRRAVYGWGGLYMAGEGLCVAGEELRRALYGWGRTEEKILNDEQLGRQENSNEDWEGKGDDWGRLKPHWGVAGGCWTVRRER